MRNSVAAALLAILVYFVHAQSVPTLQPGSPLPSVAETMSTDHELAEFAMQNPDEFAAAVDAVRTPEELVKQAFTRWAGENPAEFYQRFIKDDPAYALSEEALFAISQPVEATALKLQRMTPEEKAERERIIYAMEHPAPGL